MSHIKIHYLLNDFKDFILNVIHDAMLIYPDSSSDILLIWSLTYIKIIKLSNEQKKQLYLIAQQINNFYNKNKNINNYSDHNIIVLFCQHVLNVFLNKSIIIDLHIIEPSKTLIEKILKTNNTNNVQNIKNINVLKNIRKSVEINKDNKDIKDNKDNKDNKEIIVKSSTTSALHDLPSKNIDIIKNNLNNNNKLQE